MTIEQAIKLADEQRPTALMGPTKIRWLTELEGRIINELLKNRKEYSHLTFQGYAEDLPVTTELIIPDPYSDIYVYWLFMKTDYTNNETDRFNNDAVMYNTAYLAYVNHIMRTTTPVKETKLKNI